MNALLVLVESSLPWVYCHRVHLTYNSSYSNTDVN